MGIGRTAVGAVVLSILGCGSTPETLDESAQSSRGNEAVPTPNYGCGSDGVCGVPPPIPPPWGGDGGTSGPDASPPVAACGFTDWNEGLVGGQISDVAYDARAPGVAWAAAGNRLFKSTNSGATWSLVYEGDVFGFRKLAIPPGDPKVLLAASSNGVVRSSDGGVTWTVQGLSGLSVSTLLVHPAQPLRVYAGIRGAGIVRSNDGGLTWGSIDYSVPFGEFLSMAADPIDADTFLVAAWELDGVNGITRSVILRTTNGGQSWTQVADMPKTITYEIAVCPADPNVVYASAANYYGGTSGVLRSNDRGVTWSTTAGLASKLVTDVAISPTDCNAIYALHYDLGLKRSSDGGATFSAPLTTGIPFANRFPRHVAVDPASPARIIGASHGGVLYSADSGDHFAVVGGVMNLAIRSLAVSPLDPERLWMATWGSGVWQRASSATPWSKSALLVDYAFTVAPDPAVASRTFLGTWSYPYVTTDGATFTRIEASHNTMAFAFDPSSSSTIYMATQIKGLFKSTDGGATWATANGALLPWATGNNAFIDTRAVLVDRNASNRVLVGTAGRGIHRSEDGGVTLEPVAPALPTSTVTCLVQTADGAFYACVSGAGIAKSTDLGATFSYVNTGLPSLNVAGLIADGSTLYSTSNLGVFSSTNGAVSWSALDTACLPSGGAGVVNVIGAGSSKKLVVGTGRGVFAYPL